MDIFSKTIAFVLTRVILGYQKSIRPWLKTYCKYQPTCSEYALMCLNQLPVHKAVVKILKRILSCNPFVRGGVDCP